MSLASMTCVAGILYMPMEQVCMRTLLKACNAGVMPSPKYVLSLLWSMVGDRRVLGNSQHSCYFSLGRSDFKGAQEERVAAQFCHQGDGYVRM